MSQIFISVEAHISVAGIISDAIKKIEEMDEMEEDSDE